MSTGVSGAPSGDSEERDQAASPASSHEKRNSGYGKVALSALFWSYSRSFVYTLITIPTTVILARLLSPGEFGIAAAATFFSQLASNLSTGGMGTALVRMKTIRDEHVSSVFVFNAVVSLTAYAALLIAAPFIGRFYASPEVARLLPLVGLSFVMTAVFTVPQVLLGRDLRYRDMSAASTFDLVVTSVMSCTLAYAGFSYWSLVLGDLTGALAKGILTSYLVRWRPRFRFSREAVSELFSFGMGSYTSRVLTYVSLNVDNLIIGRVLGMSALGFYDKGFSVCNRFYKTMTQVAPGVTFRIFSIIQDDEERFRKGYRKVILSSTLVSYPLFAGLVAVARPLFVVAFGEKWLPAVLPFQIICVSFMFKLTSTYVGTASQARGWIWSAVWRQLVYILLIAGNVYLFSRWGINGAAFGVLTATFVGWILAQQLLTKATSLGWRDIFKPQAPAFVCAVVMIVLVNGAGFLMTRVSHVSNPWLLLLVQTAIGSAFYVLFLRFSGFREVQMLVRDTLVTISPKLARLAPALK